MAHGRRGAHAMYSHGKLAALLKRESMRHASFAQRAIAPSAALSALAAADDLSRRGFIAATAAAAIASGGARDAEPKLSKIKDDFAVGFGDRCWLFRRDAFGPFARISAAQDGERFILRATRAVWMPGGARYNLAIALAPATRVGPGSRWRISAAIPTIGFRASEWFDDFLSGQGLGCRVQEDFASELSSAFGWRADQREAKRLVVQSDLDWMLSGATPLRADRTSAIADRIVLRIHPPASGPQDQFLRESSRRLVRKRVGAGRKGRGRGADLRRRA